MRSVAWVLLCWIHLAALAGPSLDSSDGFLRLENGGSIRAVISPEHGGELTGFAVNFNGEWRELLYRAQDYGERPGWRGKAPLLWPAVGVSMLPDEGKHHWELNGKVLSMPFHGFVRNQRWQVLEFGKSREIMSARLDTRDNQETRRHYPFGFVLQVEYRLESERLRLIYTVSAAHENNGPMPFSIGNHITFRAPLIPGPEPTEIRFQSDFPELLVRAESGAFSGRIERTPFQGIHELSVLPHRNAVGLGGLQGAARLTVFDPSGLQIAIEHRASSEPSLPTIRFNLWADTQAGFFSPEPWLGTQNSLNSGAGLVRLEPGDSWTWTIDIIPGGLGQPGTAHSEESP